MCIGTHSPYVYKRRAYTGLDGDNLSIRPSFLLLPSFPCPPKKGPILRVRWGCLPRPSQHKPNFYFYMHG